MRPVILALVALAPVPAMALEIGTSDFRYSSELMAEGAEPVATSGVGNAIYGLRKDSELFLCFLADTQTAQGARQRVLLDEIAGEAADRSVPNIAVLCVKTQ